MVAVPVPMIESGQASITPTGSFSVESTESILSVHTGMLFFGLNEVPCGKVKWVFFSGFTIGDEAGVVTSETTDTKWSAEGRYESESSWSGPRGRATPLRGVVLNPAAKTTTASGPGHDLASSQGHERQQHQVRGLCECQRSVRDRVQVAGDEEHVHAAGRLRTDAAADQMTGVVDRAPRQRGHAGSRRKWSYMARCSSAAAPASFVRAT